MSICVRVAKEDPRHPIWPGWTVNIDDAVVQFCRDAFKGKYRGYWVYPVYIDNRYAHFTHKFFKEAGVELLPKLHKLPDCPQHPKGRNPYNYRGQLVRPNSPNLSAWEAWKTEMDAYQDSVWDIVWGDYTEHVEQATTPKLVVVKGVRLPTGEEHFIGVEEVHHFRDDLPEME